ncbi:hypothetical protein BX666DRAFT_2100201 [Dichotomocladium elegans]|nr:hypothetical protein BX666DRAFT_2100201 [Dichotomocladium elegans]
MSHFDFNDVNHNGLQDATHLPPSTAPMTPVQLQALVLQLSATVEQHSSVISDLLALRKENEQLKAQNASLIAKMTEMEKTISHQKTQLQHLSVTNKVSEAPKVSDTDGKSQKEGNSYSDAAKRAPKTPAQVTPARPLKKRISAARPFRSAEAQGPKGFEYYAKKFIAIMTKAQAQVIEDFDPLDPAHLADPKYASLSETERLQETFSLVHQRAMNTLSFVRPVSVAAVGRFFVELSWIDDNDLLLALQEAKIRLAKEDPKQADFVFRNLPAPAPETTMTTPSAPSSSPSVLSSLRLALWNANGLRATTVHDVLSHSRDAADVLFITETWLTSGLLPTNWSQYHLYGKPVVNAHGRGSAGICCLVSPSCPFLVHQLPSYNAHTLSMKIGRVTVHCLYLPPSLSSELALSVLNSLPLSSDTVLCGDFNARLGALTGDLVVNPRGRSLLPWLGERALRVLNAELSHGVATFTSFRRNVEVSSIIDLFLTNIPTSGMVSPSLSVESDLSLGSDHRLMFLSFGYIPSNPRDDDSSSSSVLAPRRLWNLSRLNEVDPLLLYRSRFHSLVAPLAATLSELVSSPSGARPPIDSLNDSLNEYDSIGPKASRPGYWKKYWTPHLEAAARERDRRYRVDKAYWWTLYQDAHRSFRHAVAAAKRLSWKNFCASLEKDFSKATATLARLKRRKQASSSYTHPDGPQSAVDTMAAHLATVYDGSLLSSADRPAPPPDFSGLYGPGILALRSSGAVKTMALLNSVGVNRNGFSLLLSSRLYTCFIRPKLEYGLAISRLTSSDVKALDKLQNRLVGMFLGSSWVNVAKHITCIHPFLHRYKVLMTRYVLRSRSLAGDCLVILLRDSLRYPRLVQLLSENSLYRSLPVPPPTSSSALKALFDSHWQEQFDRQMSSATSSGKFALLRACRPSVSRPDPILYLPMSRTARSRLVRWRLGRFTNMDEECPCVSGARLSRDHFLVCRAIDPSLIEQLPPSPPSVNRIDHALNSLPLSASDGPPPFWSALLSLLYVVDTLCHPLAHIAPDPDPGDSWFSVSASPP